MKSKSSETFPESKGNLWNLHPKTATNKRQKWEASGQFHIHKEQIESNPVDNTVLDELPASNGHGHMEDILREEVKAAIRNLKQAEGNRRGQHCSRNYPTAFMIVAKGLNYK